MGMPLNCAAHLEATPCVTCCCQHAGHKVKPLPKTLSPSATSTLVLLTAPACPSSSCPGPSPWPGHTPQQPCPAAHQPHPWRHQPGCPYHPGQRRHQPQGQPQQHHAGQQQPGGGGGRGRGGGGRSRNKGGEQKVRMNQLIAMVGLYYRWHLSSNAQH